MGRRDAESGGASRSRPVGGNAGRRQGSGRAWDDEPALDTPRNWGGLARRGAGEATGRRVTGASRAWREAVEAAEPRRTPSSARRAAADPRRDDEAADAERRAERDARAEAEWVLVEEVRDEASGAVSRGGRPQRSQPAPLDLAEEVRAQLAKAVGTARTERVERRLGEAAEHFEHERYADAARILKKLADEAPTVAAVRELYGLTLYRQGKWTQAARELEAFRLLSGSTEQHPVLADCYRALRQWPQVEELWGELRAASPNAELVTEGRIVVAGSLADRDRTVEAIELLQKGWSFPKRPQVHHLRRAYALADLYERTGEVPRARELFRRIAAVDPDVADVEVRLRGLG